MVTKTNASQITYDSGTVQDVLDAVTGPTGAASIRYAPSGVGAVSTTVEDQLRREPVQAVNHGADPTKQMVEGRPFECAYDLNGANPVEQAYNHLKTLPEYADALDC